jgi:hypothetical protein
MITSGLGKEFVIGHTLNEARPAGEWGIQFVPCQENGRNSRFPATVQECDRSADILVRLGLDRKLEADKNVRAPIT